MKAEVLAAIGEAGLSRSAAVNAALSANDRVKYLLSLLQMAATHAEQPDQPPASLKRERIGCGIDEPSLDAFTAAAVRQGPAYHMPGADKLLARIAQDLSTMAAPVLQAGIAGFDTRLHAALAAMPQAAGDTLDAAVLAAMGTGHAAGRQRQPAPAGDGPAQATQRAPGRARRGDHRRRRRLWAGRGGSAPGGRLHGRPQPHRAAEIRPPRPGHHRHARGEKLVLQNDIGTTDAHVVVIHVEG